MAKPLKMTELVQVVKDAEQITAAAFQIGPSAMIDSPQDEARLERQNVAFGLVLTELLDNEYTPDMR